MSNRRLMKIVLAVVCIFASGWETVASAQTWTERFPTGIPPAGRTYVASGNTYDEINDRLIIFSGDDGSSVHPHAADVWVLVNATGQSGTPAWVQLAPVGTGPIGRTLHSTVYDPVSNRLIVHGGCVGHCGQILSDVWVLTNANGIGGPPAWIELTSAPLIRNGHTAVYDPGSNRMVIFGGGTPSDTNEVWVLTDANGIGSPVWQQLAPIGAPPPPRGAVASAVYDPFTNRLIVVGGRSGAGGGTAFNDVWILSNANGLGGTPVWTQLTPSGLPPAPRGGHSLVYDRNANRVIIFGGGTGDLNTYFNDVWVLTNANGTGGLPAWIQLIPMGSPPLPRYIFVAGYSAQSNRMVVTMGTSLQPGSLLLNDVWVLTFNQTPIAMCQNVTVSAGANCTANASINNGSFDPDGDQITVTQSPAGPYPLGDTLVTLTVTDSKGASSQCTATVTVNNPNPSVTITNPPSGAVFAVGTPVNFSATFTDNPGQTHTASWMFDSITLTGTVNESLGQVNDTYTFTTPGVYKVKLTVADGCGGAGTATTVGGLEALVVIYDPNGGFVTGGGWINSPAGAYTANASLTGKANFGFVSKYQPGATVPIGQTEFQFKVAGLNFQSANYDWLVVAGARAQYKGSGAINGSGNYGFLLTAIDGQLNGGGGADKFRIKIWNKGTGDIVYDNQIGDDDGAEPSTVLGGGSIIIHK